MEKITLVECPRDAMQGWPHFIPTATKITYLNQLLRVGFDVLDFGSFVNPKAIPQMADTKEVLAGLDMGHSRTKLLAIVANTRGAEEAVPYEAIHYLGFPFSISETFQQLNTNKSIAESLVQVAAIQELCERHNKELVLYISMGFGNPYGDEYSAEVALDWFDKLQALGIKTIALADTVGVAKPETIAYIYRQLVPAFPEVNIGAHFHSTADTWLGKIEAAYQNGCRRFDSSIRGIGGCPMAKNELVGNIATENLLAWANGTAPQIDKEALMVAMEMANRVFAV
ncbi:MAG: hydroxymethylglutaryl-CoA lyase [Edaphocola sp.]